MRNQGFTLIELIIVIAIIALLAAATFVAVDPAKRIGEAQDAQRWSDVTAIVDAYMKYLVDNTGTAVTSTNNGTTYFIQHTAGADTTDAPDTCVASTTIASELNAVDLHGLVTNGYIGDIPDDPVGTDADGTDYYFYKDATGKVIVGACTSSTYGDDAVIRAIR